LKSVNRSASEVRRTTWQDIPDQSVAFADAKA
jgi:hypothetical protein